MSERIQNKAGLPTELQVANGDPAAIGRGAGMTLKEISKRLTAHLKRKGMAKCQSWRLHARIVTPRVHRDCPVAYGVSGSGSGGGKC